MSAQRRRVVDPIAYQRAEAAAACGVGTSFFDQHIAPCVPCRYIASVRLWLARDLEAFMVKLPRATINGSQEAAPATRERPGARPKEANAP